MKLRKLMSQLNINEKVAIERDVFIKLSFEDSYVNHKNKCDSTGCKQIGNKENHRFNANAI